jgi:hypothetical protein
MSQEARMRWSARVVAVVVLVVVGGCDDSPAAPERHCNDDSCNYLGVLVDVGGRLQDDKSQAATTVSGQVSLDRAGAPLEISFEANGATLSGGDTGIVDVWLDPSAPKTTSLIGDSLSLKFGVQVSSDKVDAAMGLVADTFCVGGDKEMNGCSGDADCDDGTCLAMGTCSCDSDSVTRPRASCMGTATGGKGDDGALRTEFHIDCDPAVAGFTRLQVTAPLHAAGLTASGDSALRSALESDGGAPGSECAGTPYSCPFRRFRIQPVALAEDDGSNPTMCPSFDFTRDVFGRCCVTVEVACTVTLKSSRFRNLQTNRLKRKTDQPRMTADEAALFATSLPLPAGTKPGLPLYCIDQFVDAATGVPSKDIHGGGITWFLTDRRTGKRFAGSAVVVDGARPGVLAHEMGHALDLDHTDFPTVMKPANHYNRSPAKRIFLDQCVTTGGSERARPYAPGCCKKPDVSPPPP